MELTFFFPYVSRAQRLALPGLEPRSSDLEPSALTTGLLDKAVALACQRYSWPHMLKVAPWQSYHRTVVQSYGRTVVRLYSCTSKFFQLDGLLLFFIIMGLRELLYYNVSKLDENAVQQEGQLSRLPYFFEL